MRVALVTGTVDDELAAIVAATEAPLRAALQDRDVDVALPSWRDGAVDWSNFDLAVVRTTWDYTADRDAFVGWAVDVESVTPLANPAEVLRWNTHKGYLVELEDRGAPIVPTAWLAAGDRIELADLLVARGWDRAVLKPAVASGSDGLLRVGSTGADGDAPPSVAQHHLDVLLDAGDVMIQPYLASVETRGELSVVVFAGEVSHAVRKTPVSGEFRIQEQFGGRYVQEPLVAEVRDLADWVVQVTGAELLYARVDLLEADDGALQVAELEVTEPDLYLGVVPAAAERFADAIVARAGT